MNNDVSQKLRLAVKSKLTSFDAYIDDELPDLILVMLARKKTESDMIEELDPFLEENAKIFVTWLHKLYTKLVGMANVNKKPGTGYIPSTTQQKRIQSSDEETKVERRRSRSISNSSQSTNSSSRSRSRSKSRGRNKRSDAYGGRRKKLDLAKTYRNSSSEGSHSKGLHLRPKVKSKKRRRHRHSSGSRSRSRSYHRSRRSRSTDRRRRSYSRDGRRSKRTESIEHRKYSKDSRKSRRHSSDSDNEAQVSNDHIVMQRLKRDPSFERKFAEAEKNLREKRQNEADQGDGFGWTEAPNKTKLTARQKAEKLLEDELVALAEEKRINDEEKRKLELERLAEEELKKKNEEWKKQNKSNDRHDDIGRKLMAEANRKSDGVDRMTDRGREIRFNYDKDCDDEDVDGVPMESDRIQSRHHRRDNREDRHHRSRRDRSHDRDRRNDRYRDGRDYRNRDDHSRRDRDRREDRDRRRDNERRHDDRHGHNRDRERRHHGHSDHDRHSSRQELHDERRMRDKNGRHFQDESDINDLRDRNHYRHEAVVDPAAAYLEQKVREQAAADLTKKNKEHLMKVRSGIMKDRADRLLDLVPRNMNPKAFTDKVDQDSFKDNRFYKSAQRVDFDNPPNRGGFSQDVGYMRSSEIATARVRQNINRSPKPARPEANNDKDEELPW